MNNTDNTDADIKRYIYFCRTKELKIFVIIFSSDFLKIQCINNFKTHEKTHENPETRDKLLI